MATYYNRGQEVNGYSGSAGVTRTINGVSVATGGGGGGDGGSLWLSGSTQQFGNLGAASNNYGGGGGGSTDGKAGVFMYIIKH